MAEEITEFNQNIKKEELVGCSIVNITIQTQDNNHTNKIYKLCDPYKIKPPSLNLYSKDLIGLRAEDDTSIVYYSYSKTTNNNICRTYATASIYSGNLNPYDLLKYSDDVNDPECNRNQQYDKEEIKKIIIEGIYPEPENTEREARRVAQLTAGFPETKYLQIKDKCYVTSKTIIDGACSEPQQFTNVSSERKSRKIEHFEANNNLKCRARY